MVIYSFLLSLSILSLFVVYITPLPATLERIFIPLTALFIFIWARKRPDKFGLERYLFFSFSSFVIFKYWYWRLTETLFYFSFLDFLAGIILILAEIYSLIMLISGMFVCINFTKRGKRLDFKNKKLNLPTIDIFIPTYNEPFEIIEPTVLGALNLLYPKNKIKVYLLDDGATEEKRNSKNIIEKERAIKRYNYLKNFCQKVGAIYLTRKNNEHAKAGNLNEALNRTSGELIAVFDCDHVPTKDFLIYTVPYFLDNPSLFVVQTPHFFINPDPIEKNLRTFYAAPSENEMFYRKIQPGLDFWNSTFFCGSAALLKRDCLLKIGGFLGKTVTEDAETSINLHSLGYDSAYVDKPLICGLTPETFTSFIRQRIRWAQGMTQIFIMYNPLFKKGLKWYQKICYNNCIFFWFYGFARLIFILAPLFFIFFNLYIYNASLIQILTLTFPYVLTIYSIDYFLYGKVRWPFFSEIYETITSIYILPAVIKTLINPKKPKFTVTPKKEDLTRDIISPLSKPFYILFLVLISGLFYGIWRLTTETFYRDTLLLTIGWTIFNAILVFLILGALYERKQLRRFHRAKAWGEIFIENHNYYVKGTLKDLSLSGIGFLVDNCEVNKLQEIKLDKVLRIYTKDSFNEKYSFQIKITRIEKTSKVCIIGARFLINSIDEYKKLVSFVYGDSERWQKFLEEKEKNIGYLDAIIFLIKYTSVWSLKSIIEFARTYLLKRSIKTIKETSPCFYA